MSFGRGHILLGYANYKTPNDKTQINSKFLQQESLVRQLQEAKKENILVCNFTLLLRADS